MIKYVIHAKEWRDKVNGNSYHSVNVLNTQNNLMIASPFTYGYGSQFLQTAAEAMVKQGWLPEAYKNKIVSYSGLSGNHIHNIIEKNCTKKEVISHGKER